MSDSDVEALERIERQAWRDLASAAPADFAARVGLETHELGRALMLMASRAPIFQFNWLSGAGLDGADADAIPAAIQRFRDAGQRRFFVQIPPSSNAGRLEAQARAAGLAPHRLAWVKFERETRDPPRVETDLSVHEVGGDARDLFAATVAAGYGLPSPVADWLREIVGRPGWNCYVCFADDEPAGAGALFVDEDAAWLGVGATKPAFRRRGGQSALIARRLADAARRGARFAVTETAVPQPDESAPSHRNILAAGFRAAYVRPNWALPA
ncbi:MAG: GNAT family N-acetyltransferase [Roseiarcus sp.]